jgi:acyl-coenzyme A synthetase/AMP-(fatty) acid ligase
VTTFRTRRTGALVYRDEDGYFFHMDRLVDSVEPGNGKRLFTAMSEERILAACPDVVDESIPHSPNGRVRKFRLRELQTQGAT